MWMAWGRVAGTLSLEDAISVSEQAMERGGLAGRTIHVPTGREDDPDYQAAIAPLTAFVREATGTPHLRIYHSQYALNVAGNPAALTDGMNYIVVRKVTNEMTILHECAHVIRRTSGASGHDRAFAVTVRDLYAKHISPAAGEQFWSLLDAAGYV
jgi:hypothetical protein